MLSQQWDRSYLMLTKSVLLPICVLQVIMVRLGQAIMVRLGQAIMVRLGQVTMVRLGQAIMVRGRSPALRSTPLFDVH